MKQILILIGISTLIYSCAMKEEYVGEDRVTGLYARDYYDEKEYLCLKSDSTYSYFLKKGDSEEALINGKWSFNIISGKSYLSLNRFNYSMEQKRYLTDTSGIGVPVKYSHAKKAVILRMDADAYSRDFVRVDSLLCSVK